MKAPSWNDLALFAAVARHGSLAAAARETSVSQATLSRRMTALEAQLGRRLFHHGRAGYRITSDGRALLGMAERMEAAAAEIRGWQDAQAGPVRVRVSAGTWTALHLAESLPHYWNPHEIWMPEFLHSNLEMDIARREIDLGIRNRRPDKPWLAGRRTGTVRYAVYARSSDTTGWIGTTGEAAATPSADWVRARHGSNIVTTANDPRVALALAQAGAGRVVLPTFAGASRTNLVQIGPAIAELTSEEWLVSHHEGRHEPPVRAALDAIGAFLSDPARATYASLEPKAADPYL